VQAATDAVIYELHARDFSIGDARYDPITAANTSLHAARNGRHAAPAALAAAGVTDVHLLPVFDFGSVPDWVA